LNIAPEARSLRSVGALSMSRYFPRFWATEIASGSVRSYAESVSE
jgi:hypothetical protein